MAAHRHRQWGHLSTPGKSLKVLSLKKSPISEVSLNSLDTIGLDYSFLNAIKEARVVVLVIWRRTRGCWTRPHICDWEANANCPQILPYTQETRGKNRSRQWSSRGKKICTKSIYVGGLGNLQRSPRHPSWWGGRSQSLPKNQTRLGRSGLGSFPLPWKKSCGRPCWVRRGL